MFSSLVEIAAFAAITEGVYQLAGSGWAWVAAGIFGIIVGLGVNDAGVSAQVRRMARAPVLFVMRIRLRLRRDKTEQPSSPHPQLAFDEELEDYARWAAESAERRVAASR